MELQQVFELIKFDLRCAITVAMPTVLACAVIVRLFGRRGNRLPAFAWGLLAGSIVAFYAWWILLSSWREQGSELRAGIGRDLMILFLIAAAACLGGIATMLIALRLPPAAAPVRRSWMRSRVPLLALGAIVVASIVLRIPIMQNEFVWGRANIRLKSEGMIVGRCEHGQVLSIDVQFRYRLKAQRLPAGPKFSDRIAEHPKLKCLRIDQLNINDAQLLAIARLSELEWLEVGSDWLTDQGVVGLENTHKLKRLSLKCPRLTDASMKTIASLENLEILILEGACISDHGLWELRTLRKLKHLTLQTPNVTPKCPRLTDASMKTIASLENLEILNLEGACISDHGLWELRTLRKLKHLTLRTPNVTPEGIAKFKAERHKRTFVWNSMPSDQ